MEPNISIENKTQLADLGVTQGHVDQFNYQQFKYTNLKDSLAQAQRDNVGANHIMLTGKHELPKHGITLTQQECFRFLGYQYSNLKDAVAQAMRTND